MQAASAASLQLDSRYRFRIFFKKDTGCRTVPVAHQLSAVTNFMLKKQFLASEMEGLQAQESLLRKKLARLNTQKAIENSVDELFQLEHLISDTKDELEHIQHKMLQLEAKSMADGKDVVDCGQRIELAQNQLAKYFSKPAIREILPKLGEKLEKMGQEGIAAEDEIILNKIGELSEQLVSPEEFAFFFKELEKKKKKDSAEPEYSKLAERLKKGKVVLFLGQDIGSPALSTQQLIAHLVGEKGFRGSFSELCEQEEISPDCGRDELIEKIQNLLQPRSTSPIPLYKLLARLDIPMLVISAAYDDMLEQSLLWGRRKFAVIYPNLREEQCLVRYSGSQDTETWEHEEISNKKPLENGCSVIYKLRGGVIDDRETLLLSERDYFNFIKSKVPDYIKNKLSSYALWFLGHHPQSWEERLLITSLQSLRRDSRSAAFAVQKDLSEFSRAFWKDNRVECFDIALPDFIDGLAKEAV